MANPNEDALNPTVTAVVRRFGVLIVLGVIVFGALGYLAGRARTESFEATASLVLQDPGAQTLFEPVFGELVNVDPERFTNNQLAILDSALVAGRAASLLGRDDSVAATQAVLDSISLGLDARSDVISITFSADTAAGAVSGANAVLGAYLEIVEDQSAAAFAAALAQLDAALAAAAGDIDGLRSELDDSEGTRRELDQQLDQLTAELLDLSDVLVDASAAVRPQLNADLADLVRQVEALQTVRGIEEQRSDVVALRAQLNEAVNRESALLTRRNQLLADAEIPRSELAVASPAVFAESSETGLFISAAAGAIFGLVAAGAFAYWYSQRRQRFENERQLATLLDVPLLAVVPAWTSPSLVPLAEDSPSPASGALRALVWAVRRRVSEVSPAFGGDANGSPAPGTLLLVTSTDRGAAGAAVAVNLALASVEAGVDTLLIDADDIEQRASTAIRELGGDVLDAGLRDALRHEVEPDEAVSAVAIGESSPIHFISAGNRAAPNDPIPRIDVVEGFVKWAASRHDLVILHVPRLPEQLHLGALLSCVPHSLLVVRHRSAVGDALGVADRLGVVGAPPIGCVYLYASRSF